MNIEGLGESLIAQIIERGPGNDYADVYALTAEKLRAARADGQKSAAKVMLQIDKSRTNELWRLIYGLGIRHVGERASQVLARAFGSMDALCAATIEQLQETPEIGPVLAESVRSWLDEPRNRQLIDRLRAAGVNMEVPLEQRASAEPPGPLDGQDLRHHRHPGVDVARSGYGGAGTPRRQGRRTRSVRRRRASLSGRSRAQRPRRRGRSDIPLLDEASLPGVVD